MAPVAALPDTFTYADAQRDGVSDRRLRALVEQGAVYRIGRGVYRKVGAAAGDEDLHEVAARAPVGTLCLTTALARHGLTDQIPDRIDVALPRYQRAPRVTARVAWHRFDAATYDLGREVLVLEDGLTLGLYGPERCIVDSFRLRHLGGDDVAFEALRRWLRRAGATPSSLLSLAGRFPKAERAIRDALKALL